MFWLIFTVFDTALAAFCGSSLVPYSLEVLPGGGTVLGCARPACFGWDPTTGQRASDDYSFIQQQGYRDGFLRGDPAQRQPFAPSVPQTATCFPALSCTSGQWASGFVAGQNGVAPSLMCCSYPPLAQAEDLGVAPVGPGNIAYGGEGPGGGQVAYFDYLRNIQPVMGADGQIAHYDVEMGRMHCQEPPALPAPVVPQQVYQPPAQPAYTPTSYWGSLPPYTCFPADSKVLMYDMTERRMDELEISEWVMTPSSNLSSLQGNQIKNWLHRMPEVVTEFLVITTGQGKEVKLTRRHLIVRVSCADPGETETIPAEEVELGDFWKFFFWKWKNIDFSLLRLSEYDQSGNRESMLLLRTVAG